MPGLAGQIPNYRGVKIVTGATGLQDGFAVNSANRGKAFYRVLEL